MNIFPKSGFYAALALAFAVPASAMAQQATTIVPGMRVEGSAGGLIGTVTAFDGTSVTVKTDRHSVQIAKTSFAQDKGRLLLGMTQAQLNDSIDRSLADAATKLVPGASVVGSQGAPVGTISAIDDQFATLKLTTGKLVKIPRAGLAAGANGPTIGMTASALDAAATAAAAAPPAAAAATTTPATATP